ncbi:hypothetical protein P3102_35250 [Amycolatopsis sp. QT-25]|uniref:hypothetical protein n=1 Tax=Amycolatopsis sp. QT-25 TaxID=3034022 RepID=UPI0023EC7F93|nr:hypothetical protein [Amycolatopsis sp. QT-25]WET79227.1 hypothetical protein P3102_35250 [Amycolatopsis sp. QT-25]
MSVAAEAIPPGLPWWVYAATSLVTLLVAYVAAKSPVWVEKAKGRIGKAPDPPPTVEKTSAGESILREWRDATQADLDEAEQKNDLLLGRIDQLQERIRQLEAELHRRGWDGRLAP